MEPQIILFVAVSAAVGAALGWGLGRFGSGRAAGVATAALAVAAAALMIMARNAQGWDAIGYSIFSILIATPATLGSALGGWVGARMRQRRTGR